MAVSRFSVVMPYYDGDRFVRQAIQSALEQTYGELEVIVVDDGSPSPGAADRLDAIAGSFHDPRVRVFHKPNEGLSATRNYAIAHATGDLVALLDQDDVWLPAKLAREAEVFASQPAVDLVFSKLVTIGQRHGEIRPADLHGDGALEDPYTRLVKWDFIPCATTTVRRRAVERIGGFDPRYAIVEEYDLFLRMAAAGMIFYFIDEILGRVRLHADNYTRHFEQLHRECLDLFARYPVRGWRQRYNRTWNRAVVHAARARDSIASGQIGGVAWLGLALATNPVAVAELAAVQIRRALGWSAPATAGNGEP